MSGRLEGKRALVTGGGSGIGEAIVRRFISEGAKVIVAERDSTTRHAVEAAGAIFEYCDVAHPDEIGRAAESARQGFGTLDIAVANAGYEQLGDALELSYEEWDEHQSVMLRGVYATFRSTLPMMVQQGSGVLVAVASQLAFVGLPRFTSYLAAKSGVLGLVRAIAIDFGTRGIRANALCPGPTMTPLIEQKLIAERGGSDDLLTRLVSRTAMNRLGKPEEIASAALFLASDDSSYMTGASLIIDGGYTAM